MQSLMDVDGVMRPVLNSAGRRIHPTEEGVENFWRWFGNSKAVDGLGRPLVVYHGTQGDFEVFRDDIEGRAGFYFTDDLAFANGFAEGDGANLLPVFLRVSRPVDFRSGVPSQIEEMLETAAYSRLSELLGRDPREIWNHFDGDRELADVLQAAGHDGMRFAEPEYKRNIDSWVAFSPVQIKSAIGNSGRFAPDSPLLTDRFPRCDLDFEGQGRRHVALVENFSGESLACSL